MDAKKKLIEIMQKKPYSLSDVSAGLVADHLLLYDVTVQVHARWLYMGKSDGKKIYSCTNCASLVHGGGDFCKVCGAKMDLPQISQSTADALEEIGRQAHEVTP